MMMAVVFISGRSAVPARPAEPALLMAHPAEMAAELKAMAAQVYFAVLASVGTICIASVSLKEAKAGIRGEARRIKRK